MVGVAFLRAGGAQVALAPAIVQARGRSLVLSKNYNALDS